MELAEALRRRRMVRRYTDTPIASGAIDRIVAAGLSAPSAGFAQGVSIIAVTEPARIVAIAAACGEAEWVQRGFEPWLSTAPAHLVICLEPEVYRTRYAEADKDPEVLATIPWWWVDGGATLMAMLLATVDEGLTAGFQGGHRTGSVPSLLGIPDEVILLGIVTVGHPAPHQRLSSLERGERAGKVHRETW